MKFKIKKRMIGLIAFLIAMSCLIIGVYAETVTAEERIVMDEKSFVRMTAMSAKLKSSSTAPINADILRTEMESAFGSDAVTIADKSSDTILVTFTETGNQYEISNISVVGGGYDPVENPEIPEPEDTEDVQEEPYLPTGFTVVSTATETKGHTIKDSSNNEYVWIEVPQDTTVYSASTLALDLDTLTGTDLTNAYTAIENDLHTYTAIYRGSTSYTDTWYSEEQHGFASADEYNEQKYKMLKSVFENGGFYIGKYETGTMTARTSSSDALTTAVIQANAYPYNYVTNKQAQSLASGMASGEYTSSLMFGVQWDLVLKYIETKGAATVAQLNSDSTSWGNYSNNLWNITNTSAKYSTNYGSSWTDGAYGEKTSSSSVLLSTGADSSFSKMGIYDIAGNVQEWTLEYADAGQQMCTFRGGYYGNGGSVYPARGRERNTIDTTSAGISFRVTLYKVENVQTGGHGGNDPI